MKFLSALVLLILITAAGIWIYAGRQPGPTIDIARPAKWVGASTPVQIGVAAQNLKTVSIAFEQNGKQTTLYTIAPRTGATTGYGDVKQEAPGRDTFTTTISRQTVPDLKTGAGKIIVTASAPVVRGIRTAQTTATKDVQVRLEKPTIAVLSTKHYINLGGSEMVVYRSTPADAESGVQVGDLTYPGYPASGVHVEGVPAITDPTIKVAFFALLYDQDLNTPMFAYAKDEAGNSARADFDHLTFPKPFKKSRIDLPDSFLNRVVPAILGTTDEVHPEGDILQQFLVLNGDLRRKNAATIASFARETSPEMLWNGAVFRSFTNNAVEAAFADQRTYIYHGKEVDRQVHLGFDLARIVHSPIVAANRGKVVYAAPLGIYGNCIIIDHGQGVQSLYGHLSSFGVKAGDMVEKEQQIGISGQTGLAGGDHLHFTMLVGGRMVNPVEWWDAHWIQDRIVRKLREAAGQ
jgi:murein DD-endopeptidase MepM/ murein hydrolase activator NlpD